MPPEDIQVLADSEVWQVRVAAAWSVVRECQADEAFPRRSGPLLAQISQPVLVLSGERNVPAKRELAARLSRMIPGAQLDDLSGEGHAAHHTAPAALTARCLRFFDEIGESYPLMKAVTSTATPDGARYTLAEVPEPAVGPADLLVEVYASAINQADLRHARTHFAASETESGPAIAGLELAGVVIALGEASPASPSATGSWP